MITAAGDDPKVAALVDVAAFAPDLGPSTFDAGAGFPAPALAEIRADQLGFLTWTPTGIRTDFAQDLPDVEKTALVATQGPIAFAAFATPVTTVAWRVKPTSHIVAKNDRAINPDLERGTFLDDPRR